MLQTSKCEIKTSNAHQARCHCEVKSLLGTGIICVLEESSENQPAFTWEQVRRPSREDVFHKRTEFCTVECHNPIELRFHTF